MGETMPEVEYTTIVSAPLERVWKYVENLENWCHLMIGFQALEVVDDRQSIWTVRGDVGILTREVKIKVDITEWLPCEKVSFLITGITERLEGGGAFLLSHAATDDAAAASHDRGNAAAEGGADGSATGSAPQPEPLRKKDGPLRRLRFRIARAILRHAKRKAASAPLPAAPAGGQLPAPSPLASSDTEGRPPGSAPATGETSRLTFHLWIRPLGPMAPMLELLMTPMIEPAAADLADGVRAAVES